MASGEGGFEDYARARQHHLYRTAYLLCGERDQAQDLVQTMLANLLRSWRKASRAENPDAYTKTALVRAFLSEQRKHRRESEAHQLAAERGTPGPEDRTELRMVVLEALRGLPLRRSNHHPVLALGPARPLRRRDRGPAPLPDLVPGARRLAHRRQLAERSFAGVLATALAIGAGTLTLASSWNADGVGTPYGQSEFKAQAAALLTQIWPTRGVQIRPAAQSQASEGALSVLPMPELEFELVAPDGKTYPLSIYLEKDLPDPSVTPQCATAGCDSEESGSMADLSQGGTLRTVTMARLTYHREFVWMDMAITGAPLALVGDPQLKALLANPKLVDVISLALAQGVVQTVPPMTATPSLDPATNLPVAPSTPLLLVPPSATPSN